MKICHVSSMHPADDDRIFERACVGLARSGHDVTYVVTADGEGVVDGVRITALKKRAGLARRLLSSREAARLAARSGADVIHFHDPDLLPWMLGLARSGTRVVYDIHENHLARFTQWRTPPLLRRLAGAAFRGLERMVIARCAGIVTTTRTMADMYADVARRAVVVHNVPDLERLAGIDVCGVAKEARPLVYTSGTNSPRRNCSETIEAVPAVARRVPDVLFRFVGRYDPPGYRERLERRAAELGVGEQVELSGMVPWRENFARTARAHVGLVFYADDENNRVTMPNRLFEYMLCGVAVVAHDFPELRRVVEESRCGVLVDSARPESIAEGVAWLLGHQEECLEMGRRGRAAVLERFNFNRELQDMVAFYADIVGGNGRPVRA